MSRMVLNGRIYQYGFIQASMATLVIIAVLIDELPRLFNFKGVTLGSYFLSVVVLVASGMTSIISQSNAMEGSKTLAVGLDKDLFYAYPHSISVDGEIVKRFTEVLSKMPDEQSVVVIPEGIMINYISRKKSPVSVQAFYTIKEQEKLLVEQLKQKKPIWVVFMSRDLNEYGVTRFGAKGQSGELIIDWLLKNYHVSSAYGQSPLKGMGGGEIYQINSSN